MRYKRDTVINYIKKYKPRILGVVETWLDPDYTDEKPIQIDDYIFIRNDRGLLLDGTEKWMQGGGVGCYLHKSLKHNIIFKSSITDNKQTEYLVLNITSSLNSCRTKLLFVVMYRKPHGEDLTDFFELLNVHAQWYKNLIIVGDCNKNMNITAEKSSLAALINDYALHLIPFGSTNFTDTSQTFLDIAIVDSADKVLSFSKSDTPISAGHRGINFEYQISFAKHEPKEIRFRDLKNCNFRDLENSIVSKLSNHPFFSINSSQVNPSLLVESLNACIKSSLDTFAPFVSKTLRKPTASWLSNDLKQACKDRDRLYKEAIKTNSQTLLRNYREIRRNLKKRLITARQEYFRDQVAAAADASDIWRILNKEGLTKAKNTLATNFFTPSELNNHYAMTALVHPPCTEEDLHDIIKDIDENDKSLFSLQHLTNLEIYEASRSLIKTSKGRSPDGIPLKYIKNIIDSLLSFLTYIYNASIDSCVYPDTWKKVFIIPLNKISSPKTLSDTRPIANICHIAKLFDKRIAAQIIEYLESNNLLVPFQYGFRPNYSTQLALLSLTDSIREGIENDAVTLLVLFDYKQAFNSLDHKALMIALKDLKFSGSAIKWLHSYITKRLQVVLNEDGDESNLEYRQTTSGIPQGSSLGPILFLILINSLPEVLRFCKMSYMLFADDLELTIQCHTCMLPFAIAHMNEDIEQLERKSRYLGFNFNAAKIKAMLLGSSENLKACNSNVLPPIIVNGQSIPLVSQAKSLGVILTSNLSWDAHISLMSQKVHGTLHKLRFRGWLLSREVKKMLVQALVLPLIDYACLVYNDILETPNLRVQRLVNSCIRFIFNCRKDASITPLRNQLEWLRVENRRVYMLGCQVYGILNSQRPRHMYDSISSIFQEVRRSERLQTPKIVIPTYSTTTMKNSFFVKAAELLNNLSYTPEVITSSSMFYARLNEYVKNLENS